MDKIYRIHREEKTAYRKWIAGRYYDHPDGQDISGKLCYTTKVGALIGIIGGFMNTIVPPPAVDGKTKLLRIARVFVPTVGMAFVFTCVTYYSTNIRKKDDPLNYAIGGAAAGLILGPATGVAAAGLFGPMALAMLGYAKKSAHMHHVNLIPDIKQREFSSHVLHRWDTSLTENRRGNWTKEVPTN